MLHVLAWQSIPISQATKPPQLMEQLLPPHVMGPSQALCSLQLSVHSDACVQSIPPPHDTNPQST
jgi:hypothetical protein